MIDVTLDVGNEPRRVEEGRGGTRSPGGGARKVDAGTIIPPV